MEYKIGDHLITPRYFGAYTHQGIYIGGGDVIHYSGLSSSFESGEIEISSLEYFANDNPVNVVHYTNREYTRKQSVERSRSRLGEDWYNIVFNNCEHFVTWCIMGKHRSKQVNGAIEALFEIGSMIWGRKADTGLFYDALSIRLP